MPPYVGMARKQNGGYTKRVLRKGYAVWHNTLSEHCCCEQLSIVCRHAVIQRMALHVYCLSGSVYLHELVTHCTVYNKSCVCVLKNSSYYSGSSFNQ